MIRPEQADTIKDKNVIIGEERRENAIPSTEVIFKKSLDSKESLKINVKTSRLRGQAKKAQDSIHAITQPKMLKPKNPEIGR